MSNARTARRQIRRASQSFDAITHLSGRSILMLFSEIDHLTDGRELMELSQEICRQGATPIVAGPLGELKEQLESVSCVGVDVPLHKRGFFAERAARKALLNIVSNTGVDLVHGVGPRAALFGARLAEASGVPFAATLAHPLSDHFPKEAEALIAAQRIFIANIDFTEEFLDMAPHVEERAQIATQGVDLDRFSPSAIRSSEIIDFVERYDIPHHRPVLLVKASNQGGEVQELFIRALKDLAPLEFYPIIEIPRGAKRLRDRLERALAKQNLLSEVRLMEALEDSRSLIQVSEAIMIDDYRPNSFNRCLAEAGAFGKPVLAPLSEGIKAQVLHDVNGWVFTTQGHQTLKASIAKALTLSGDRRKTMQAAAQLHVRTHYNSRATTIEILAAYEALLAAEQPFPGVDDMFDFDGDPLEVAVPDSRGLTLIADERARRRGLSLRERSPAVRTALRQPRAESLRTLGGPATRLAERQNSQSNQGAPHASDAAPVGQPFEKPATRRDSEISGYSARSARRANQSSTPEHNQAAMQDKAETPALDANPSARKSRVVKDTPPADALPAPSSNFSLLELAKKPGAATPSFAKTRAEPRVEEPEEELGPAVDLSASFKSLMSKGSEKP